VTPGPEFWLRQLTDEDLGIVEDHCRPLDAGGTITIGRGLVIGLVNEVRAQRQRDKDRRNAGEGTIWIESLVSLRTGAPLVKLHYGSVEAQLSAAEAIAHAIRIVEVAGGAHADAFLAGFLRDKVGFDPGSLGAMLTEFRTYREALAAADKAEGHS
jgi:hypothetical protein